jgi:hypothetical protein
MVYIDLLVQYANVTFKDRLTDNYSMLCTSLRCAYCSNFIHKILIEIHPNYFHLFHCIPTLRLFQLHPEIDNVACFVYLKPTQILQFFIQTFFHVVVHDSYYNFYIGYNFTD